MPQNKFIIFLSFSFLATIFQSSFSQGFGDYIKENAIETTSFHKVSDFIYESIKSKELIMIGEMHGTNEPSQLVKMLSLLILRNEDSVSVGMEISQDQINLSNGPVTDSMLRKTLFFSKKNEYGMNGKAWFDLALFCLQNPKINLFFFDNYNLDENRDSIMYTSIVAEKLKNPTNKIITLSGNIHNKILPHNGQNTMGSFCYKDSIIFNSENITSIKHEYSEGTMMNNTGNGLELRVVDFEESIYSSSTTRKNYLLFFDADYPYNGIYYTRKVTHSDKLK